MIGSLNGRGAVDRAPDGTIDSPGIQIEALTAAAAEPQAQKMNEVFGAPRAARIAERDRQMSSLSFNAAYDFPINGKRKVRGKYLSQDRQSGVTRTGRTRALADTHPAMLAQGEAATMDRADASRTEQTCTQAGRGSGSP